MCLVADNHNTYDNMCPVCAKELLDSNFSQAVIYKISSFKTK